MNGDGLLHRLKTVAQRQLDLHVTMHVCKRCEQELDRCAAAAEAGEHNAALVDRILQHPFGKSALRRFTLKHRIQHWVLSVLFILLALTGFPLKFADQDWARTTIGLFGGLQNARIVHHWSGVLLIAGFGLHVLDILRVMIWRARETRLAGKPESYISIFLKLPVAITPTDLMKAGQLMAYLLGLRRERPTFGRFAATEKFEYFGVIWGTTLVRTAPSKRMGFSGCLRWENTFSISARYSAAVRVRTVSMWATKHTRPSRMPPRATVVLPISMAKIIILFSFSKSKKRTGLLFVKRILPHFCAGYKFPAKILLCWWKFCIILR